MTIKSFAERTPVLHTSRLTLRPFAPADVDNAIAIFQSDKVNPTYMLPDFPTREAAVKLFDRLSALSNGTERLVYGIALGNTFIGFLNDVGSENGMIEVGYVIHPDYWNQGYATEALTASIEELFRLGYSTVRAGFFEENPASGRVMEKSGMHRIDFTESIDYRGKAHLCIYYEIDRT